MCKLLYLAASCTPDVSCMGNLLGIVFASGEALLLASPLSVLRCTLGMRDMRMLPALLAAPEHAVPIGVSSAVSTRGAEWLAARDAVSVQASPPASSETDFLEVSELQCAARGCDEMALPTGDSCAIGVAPSSGVSASYSGLLG